MMTMENLFRRSFTYISCDFTRARTKFLLSLMKGSLKELDLSYNKLRCLPNPTWWECEELEVLNLSHNRLSNSMPPIVRQGR